MGRSFIFTFAKTVTRSFFGKPATLMYPSIERKFYPITRGKISINIDVCIFCGMCERKCPTNAIKVLKETRDFTLQTLQCISCGVCVEVCPKKCLAMSNHFNDSVIERTQGLYHLKKEESIPPEAQGIKLV